jgi:hypothetical protein
MKKIFFFLLTSSLVFAQKKEIIDFKYRLNDPKSTVKSIEVIDAREDKDVGKFTRKDKTYTFSFPTGNAESDIENWFEKDNKKRGARELVIVLDKIKLYEKKALDKTDLAKIFISASSYEKIGTEYFLLQVIDGTKIINTWEYQNIGDKLASSLGMSLNKFITESYTLTPSKITVPEDQLKNYDEYLAQNLSALKTDHLQDGVYKDYVSFFNQKPLTGYELIKDKDGNVIRAEGKNETLRPPQQIFIYVENGIAYKSTFGGFYKIDKDDQGFYIISGLTLLSQGLKNYYIPSGGGDIKSGIEALGGAILNREQEKMLEKEEKEKVYISPLTGEYLYQY